MTPVNAAVSADPISIQTLRELGEVRGNCLSILFPSNPPAGQPSQNAVRFRHVLNKAQELLDAHGIAKATADLMLERLNNLTGEVETLHHGIAIYCWPEGVRSFQLTASVVEHICLGNFFYVKPLLPMVNSDVAFHILALSQKHPRLIRCTEHSSEEVPLPDGTPTSLWDDKGTDQPDHMQENMASGGPGTGSMRGVVSSTNTDSEDHEQYLQHFYKHLSEGVTALLGKLNGPLVIAGVEYEIGAFRRVNVYPNLVEDAVVGSADGLKGGELHHRALECMRPYLEAPLQKALARFSESAPGRISSSLKEIVAAAFGGRVLDLIVSENAEYMGQFDEARFEAKAHKQPGNGDEDLLNAALLQTVLHAGEVFVVPANKVPHGAPAVAVFRF